MKSRRSRKPSGRERVVVTGPAKLMRLIRVIRALDETKWDGERIEAVRGALQYFGIDRADILTSKDLRAIRELK